MHIIKTGKDRIVIVFPSYGFVLKIARLSFRGVKGMFKVVQERPSMLMFMLRDFISKRILRGISANLQERRTWKRTKNPFLWPTHFSFLGLINICPYAKRVIEENSFENSSVWVQMILYSEHYCWESCHTFSEYYNFCLDDSGKVRMLDYGFWCAEEVIRRYGQKLYDNLDPTKIFTEEELVKIDSEIFEFGKHWKNNRLKRPSKS